MIGANGEDGGAERIATAVARRGYRFESAMLGVRPGEGTYWKVRMWGIASDGGPDLIALDALHSDTLVGAIGRLPQGPFPPEGAARVFRLADSSG